MFMFISRYCISFFPFHIVKPSFGWYFPPVEPCQKVFSSQILLNFFVISYGEENINPFFINSCCLSLIYLNRDELPPLRSSFTFFVYPILGLFVLAVNISYILAWYFLCEKWPCVSYKPDIFSSCVGFLFTAYPFRISFIVTGTIPFITTTY